MSGYCILKWFYPNVCLGNYSELLMAIVALFAFVISYLEYNSIKISKKIQVFSEYNKRYSEDPNIVKVVKYLNYIDNDGTINNPHRIKPSNYEVEMFMRFFEELYIQIKNDCLVEETVLNLFCYYAYKIHINEDLRNMLGVKDYDDNWDDFVKLMEKYKQIKKI